MIGEKATFDVWLCNNQINVIFFSIIDVVFVIETMK